MVAIDFLIKSGTYPDYNLQKVIKILTFVFNFSKLIKKNVSFGKTYCSLKKVMKFIQKVDVLHWTLDLMHKIIYRQN